MILASNSCVICLPTCSWGVADSCYLPGNNDGASCRSPVEVVRPVPIPMKHLVDRGLLPAMATHPTPATIPDFDQGLLPAIAQDAATGRVLMLAWMNEEAWQETLATGFAVYFSRSRGKLWRKGEESGHRQRIVEIRVDCDGDTILMQVEQVGAACHEGYASCFFRRVDAAGQLEVTEPRLKDPKEIYAR